MKVSQLINRNGNPAANQFVIRHNGEVFFQSYNSLVAKIDKDNVLHLSQYWDYSNTTMKHLRIFLDDYGYNYSSSKEIRSAIKRGEIKYENNLSV